MIRFSVGRSGKNIQTDVRVIQQLLNKIDILGTQVLTTDGVAGARTIDKIQMFQRTIGLVKPDGLIEPGGKTLSALMAKSGTANSLSNKLVLTNPNGVSTDGIEVSFSSSLDSSKKEVVSQATINLIKKALAAAGMKYGVITSTIRTPQKQAEILYEMNVLQNGVRYGKAGQDVIALGKECVKSKVSKSETIQKMTAKIEQLAARGERVSKHCVPLEQYRSLNVVDLGVNSTAAVCNAKKSSFKQEALTKAFQDLHNKGEIRFIDETHLVNHAWHIEVPQGASA